MIETPERYKNAKISDFEEDHPLREVCTEYVTNFTEYFSEGKAPLFVGTSGSGKTHAAAAILNILPQITTPQISTAWFPASETINRMLDYRDLRMNDPYNSIWSSMRQTDIILFDDISTVRNSPRVMEYFWMIIEARYSEKLPTMITANFTDYEDKNIWEVIAEHFTVPFSRRLNQMSSGLAVSL